jgi:conjugative relaxase-like TrwC/TraI family protein
VVIRVTTLFASTAASTARYYTRYLTDAPGELPGIWHGTQADLLGLSGTVTTEALERLLSGHDPISDVGLGMAFTDRTVANGKTIRAVAGFDATVSAPKSLSVLWALTGDDGFAEAHDVAVQAVLSHLERYGSTTRIRSNGGRLHPDSQGLIVAGFRQTTSRADDPQLHTHLVISSKVQTRDGRWLALDARTLKRYQRSLGGLYQSVLRAEVTNRYGVAFGDIVKGQAEIAGVPCELLALFSKRTVQVDDALAVKVAEFSQREGRDPTVWEKAALTREAAADTRIHKTARPADALRPGWLNDATDIGITPDSLLVAVHDASGAKELAADVTVSDVVEVLSAAGSAWHREDVVRAFCDLQQPITGIDGKRWAQMIERAADRFIEQCVDLDPGQGVGGRVRGSDGRSEWIEPVAAHITSDAILVQEEAILTWAYDSQSDVPVPSPTVHGEGLDVLQRDAAAAVAGQDRLVLVVGPAGTGKTTMLSAAVADLGVQGRHVYGVSPTAKAARTLERETGMSCDTVAKLVHEWTRPDRPADVPWRLPRGTTLVVDEASMLGTPSLHQLTELATANGWRVALIGDPRQLQAVGRGGMFTELCATGRIIELERVHRFEQPWEAQASLLLRQGDPRALDLYEQHGRICAGTLDEHLDHFARQWLERHAAGDSVAIMASTNQQVDLINQRIQTARHDHSQLDPCRPVSIGAGECAYVGDVVATRRNHRHLITTSGERVRNRDLWTVTQAHDNGDLTVTPHSGHGQITLPAGYVVEHVRLGYAATEMGTQSDTVTASLELASHATSCRNLYVAMTRGRSDNTVCVITETHDLGEARDVLDAVLSVDRADVPANTQRRTLAAQDRHLHPRCQVPEWFDTLRDDTVQQLDQARDNYNCEQQRADELEQQIGVARRQLRSVEQYARPFDDAVTVADTVLVAATECRQALHEQLATAKRRERRILEPAVVIAEQEIHTATANHDRVLAEARPARKLIAQAAAGLNDLRDEQSRQHMYSQWLADPETITTLQERLESLDTWRHWATGHQLTPSQVNEMNIGLYVANDSNPEYFALRRALFDDPNTAAIVHRHDRGIERSRGPELSID